MNPLNAEQTSAALTYSRVAREIEKVIAEVRANQAFAPERLVMAWSEGNSILLMPAYDSQFLINKVVTVHRDNASNGLPVVQGTVNVFRKSDGAKLLELDGATVTAFRTAALSMVAMRRCGFRNIEAVTVCGSGVQAGAHVKAIHEQFASCRFRLFGRDPVRAERLVQELSLQGIDIQIGVDLTESIGSSEIVVAATNSVTPVLHRMHFSASMSQQKLIVAVGAYRSDMAELSVDLVRTAAKPIVVDTVRGAFSEAGDLIQAGLSVADVVSLADMAVHERPLDGISIFKSVGNALWDLAACRVACRFTS